MCVWGGGLCIRLRWCECCVGGVWLGVGEGVNRLYISCVHPSIHSSIHSRTRTATLLSPFPSFSPPPPHIWTCIMSARPTSLTIHTRTTTCTDERPVREWGDMGGRIDARDTAAGEAGAFHISQEGGYIYVCMYIDGWVGGLVGSLTGPTRPTDRTPYPNHHRRQRQGHGRSGSWRSRHHHAA